MMPTPEERFWAKVQKTETCWLWTGPQDTKGYGRTDSLPLRKLVGSHYSAHILAFKLLGGELIPDTVMDHLCRVHVCVNPDHLEQVSNEENVLRGVGWGAKNKRKTHCVRNHELTPENVYEYTKAIHGYNRRCCKQCLRERANSVTSQ